MFKFISMALLCCGCDDSMKSKNKESVTEKITEKIIKLVKDKETQALRKTKEDKPSSK